MLTEQEEENLELVPASEPDEEAELEVEVPAVAEVPMDVPGDIPIEVDPYVADHTLGPPTADPSFVPDNADELKNSISKLLDDVPESSIGTAYSIVRKTLDNMHNVLRQRGEIMPADTFALKEGTAVEKLLFLISEAYYDNVGSMHSADGGLRKDVEKAASYEEEEMVGLSGDRDDEDLGAQGGGTRSASSDSLTSVGKSDNIASSITMADIRKNIERIKAGEESAGKVRAEPAQKVIDAGLAKRIEIAIEMFPGKADDIDRAVAKDDLDAALTFDELEQVHDKYESSPEAVAIGAFYKKPAKPSEEKLDTLLAREKEITDRVEAVLMTIEQDMIAKNNGEPVASQNVWHKYQNSEDGRELKTIANQLFHHRRQSREVEDMPGSFVPPAKQTDAASAAQTTDIFNIEKALGTAVFRNVKDEGFMKLMFGLSIGPDLFEEKYVEFVIEPPEDAKKIKSFLRKHTNIDEIMANPEEGSVEKVLDQLNAKPGAEGSDSLLDQYLQLVLRYLSVDMGFPGAQSSKFHFNKKSGNEALEKAIEGLVARGDKTGYTHLRKILEDPENAKAVKGHLGKDWRMKSYPSEAEDTAAEVKPEEEKPEIVRKGKTFRRTAQNENLGELASLLKSVLR
tara:strand:- start:2 stop:1879 length:1878 start_codon:yes stop_codon:yes gene_type:complete